MIGFGQNKWKFLVSGIAALILCFVFQSQGGILGGSEYSADALSPTVADYLVFMELGMEVYIPSPTNPFEIPIFWLIPPILIALLVSSYPTEDLKDYAINVLCRVRNKKVWWNAKCAWVVLTVIAFYALYFAVSFLYALIGNGAVSWMPNETVENVVNGLSFAHIDAKDLYVAFCVPVAVSVALALCQMLLSFILRPVFGFLIIMVYLMASVYYFSPFLIGDYSMLIRNGFFNPESLDSPMMLIICAGVSCIALAAGNIYFDKTDLIADRKD
jgi:hypothetical protein